MSAGHPHPAPAPTVRLVRGSADADELAAVLAVLQAVAARRTAAQSHPPAAPARAAWSRPTRHQAAGTWRAAGPRPRG
ncbi:acyl-CoA carboxylase epsilon subunit [Streptomyces sp. NPDC051172]|uniref:acyl-CoA carboxylase epsilon subunit n=1 Tax=Streptomyces sp. NPDC051172 TaxID=3155796 RepID=UPI003435FC7D